MRFLKLLILFCLAIIPYIYLLCTGEVFEKKDIVHFLILLSFFILPLSCRGLWRVFFGVLVSILYFNIIFSIFSFGGFLSIGAYSSIMETNIEESLGYIKQFGLLSLVLSIILSGCVLYLVLTVKKINFLRTIHMSFTIIILCLVFPLYSYITGGQRSLHEFRINPEGVIAGWYSRNIISPVTNYIFYKKEQYLLSKPLSYDFPYNVSFGGESRYSTIYLVIGESASSNFFSHTGYKYPTSPYIDSLRSDKAFYWVHNAISPAPITRESLKRVLSFATSLNDEDYYNYINIVSAASQKGFETYWLSSQSPSGIHDTVIGKVGKSADYYIFNLVDDDLYDELTKHINKAEQQLFIIHLNGSHAPYNNYYDHDFEEMVKLGSLQPQYDATIKKTDRLLENIIKNMSRNSLLVYLSDHGEVVGYGHGLKTPSQDQFNVPFFIYDTSSSIESMKEFLLGLSSEGVFNIQMTMELMLKALGYEIFELNVPDPFYLYFSNGDIIRYDEIAEEYNKI